jgi:diguanylate cyclase (GGDEF)-like protein
MSFSINNNSNPLHNRQLGLPALIIGLVICAGLIGYGLIANITPLQRWANILTGLLGVGYAFAFPAVIISACRRYPGVWWIIVVANSLIMLWLCILETVSFNRISLLSFITMVLGFAVMAGRKQTYAFLAGSLLMYLLIPTVFHANPIPLSLQDIIVLALASAVIIETIHLLVRNIRHHFRRLEAVNQVTSSLAFSIETPQVVSLMSAAIQSVMDADTYFVGFLNGDKIDFELFYDDGIFYPATSVGVEGSLAGWVIKQRKSLLLTDTSTQIDQLQLPKKVIGKPHMSLSWMGVPLQTRETIYGVVAIASYQKKAFDNLDLELLENFSQQASITLNNATHHAEVEKKSIQDSLTNVLNHGNFLKKLAVEADRAVNGNYPICLIMLDVDYFKRYNDRYGHMVGDHVLVGLTDLARRYIKSTDLIGRWGGEEFVIALPNTNGKQGMVVAERIRHALTKLELYDRDGQPIPPPTISQGIALFPQETDEVDRLIDLADQRLYVAKERGRDQIEPAVEHWERILMTEF